MGVHITKFSQIPTQLSYPPVVRAKISQIHSSIITSVLSDRSRTIQYLKDVISLMNSVTYSIIHEEEFVWGSEDKLDFTHNLSDLDIRDFLVARNLYVSFKDIQWELDEIVKISREAQSTLVNKAPVDLPDMSKIFPDKPKPLDLGLQMSKKEDLYIKPPTVPRFDVGSVVAGSELDGVAYVIYKTYPSIPSTQNEISATTDVNLFTQKDLMKLFPHNFIPTRANTFYDQHPGMELHSIVGTILPIYGYSREELLDNIIRYPHIFKLMKMVDDKLVSFYTTIEINGELHRTSEVWEKLPESNIIPYNSDFVKEYVVRRYLLERDIKKIDHKYKLYGTLDPFLTLFTTPEQYSLLGYEEPEKLARMCVESRVSYKVSRNPVLRRTQSNV